MSVTESAVKLPAPADQSMGFDSGELEWDANGELDVTEAASPDKIKI